MSSQMSSQKNRKQLFSSYLRLVLVTPTGFKPVTLRAEI